MLRVGTKQSTVQRHREIIYSFAVIIFFTSSSDLSFLRASLQAQVVRLLTRGTQIKNGNCAWRDKRVGIWPWTAIRFFIHCSDFKTVEIFFQRASTDRKSLHLRFFRYLKFYIQHIVLKHNSSTTREWLKTLSTRVQCIHKPAMNFRW